MIRRTLLAFTILMVSLGCTQRSPDAVIESAVAEAQAGRLDAFLAHFEPATRQRLALYWAVSSHYGYLDEKTLPSLGDLTVESVAINGDRATAAVRDSHRSGTLELTLVDGQWLIALPLPEEVAP